eukprot:TRINITY_DN5098_c1_g1_i1.p1 TRINITY_DN5098_c1_g1~~TRINITY_DN5098_c1_g1_i1.p1  ORF type:complete len:184 (+),score=48.46 TRINITY_DN5098_c1_g1_i1:83-634(+)
MSVDSDVQQEMVESLTYRLDKLQDNLTGAADIHQVQHYPFSALEMTSRIQNRVSIFVTKYEQVASLQSRLDELSSYLTMEEEVVSAEGISEIILSRSDAVMKQVGELEQLEQLKQYAAPIPADNSSLQQRIRPLIEITLEQSDDAENITSQVQEVVARYNTIISAVSNQFLVWDELLTRLETN